MGCTKSIWWINSVKSWQYDEMLCPYVQYNCCAVMYCLIIVRCSMSLECNSRLLCHIDRHTHTYTVYIVNISISRGNTRYRVHSRLHIHHIVGTVDSTRQCLHTACKHMIKCKEWINNLGKYNTSWLLQSKIFATHSCSCFKVILTALLFDYSVRRSKLFIMESCVCIMYGKRHHWHQTKD